MNNTYAGFWLRFVAYIIDYIIIWVAQSFIFIPILGILGLSFATGMEAGGADVDSAAAVGMLAGMMAAVAATALLSGIIALLYWTLMESSKFQGTVGKIALGIKVTDLEGNKLDFVKALVRNLCKNNLRSYSLYRLYHGWLYRQEARSSRHDRQYTGG